MRTIEAMHLIVLLCSSWIAVQAKTGRNFIFFQPDEMRAESVGCYGHPSSKTPNFDKLAAEGTRFNQAHVSNTVCSQSRVAFMTGWPTHVNGHRSLWSLLHDWEPNLLKYLKQDGYTVKWWGKNDLLAADAWNRSVTSAMSYLGLGDAGLPIMPGQPGAKSMLFHAFPLAAKHTMDYKNVFAAIEWLKSKPQEPFMIFLPTLLPHPPYSAPEPWYSSIDADSLPPLRPPNQEGKPDYHALIREYRDLADLDDAFFRRLQAVYLGSISYSDYLFGQLMEALEESGLADNTTVSVFSDHGDYAGDYGLVEKWDSGLEDVLTRVPLIVKTPSGAKGHVVEEPVQVFDIVPTILELAGIQATHVHFAQSLVPQLLGAAGDPTRAVFSEAGMSTLEPRTSEANPVHGPTVPTYAPKEKQLRDHPLSAIRAVAIRTATHKLVVRSDPAAPKDHCSELYDLTEDPRELYNRFGNASYASVQADLKERLFQWLFTTSDVTPWNDDPRGVFGNFWPPKPGAATDEFVGGGNPPSPFDSPWKEGLAALDSETGSGRDSVLVYHV